MHDVQLLFMNDALHKMHIHKDCIPLFPRENGNPRAWTACEQGSAFHLSLSLRMYVLSMHSAPEDLNKILCATFL